MTIPPGLGVIWTTIKYPIVNFLTTKESQRTAEVLKGIVCSYQSHIVEFKLFYEETWMRLNDISEQKKFLEVALNFLGDNPKSAKDQGLKRQHEAELEKLEDSERAVLDDFNTVAVPMMGDFIKIVNEDVMKYFKGREVPLPRMSLKMLIIEDCEECKPEVYDLFRGNGPREKHYWDEIFPVSDNTAYDALLSDSKREKYMCNNIPNEIKKGRYVNQRIDLDKVKEEYEQELKYKFKPIRAFFGTDPDEKWKSVWKTIEGTTPQDDSYYKSTLVIPIGFQGNAHLSPAAKEAVAGESGVPIDGFLSFDHVYTDYFREGDMEIAYIIADLFSLIWQDFLSLGEYNREIE